jgi:23S rRNA (guanine745-N1)-methyltransferase
MMRKEKYYTTYSELVCMTRIKSNNAHSIASTRKTKFNDNISIFKCPICGTKMNIYDFKDLVCIKGHCFNIAKKGYVNFLPKPPKTGYNEKMFYSRRMISSSGFFTPVLECISNTIAKIEEKHHLGHIKILDAGCGEGSHIGQIMNILRSDYSIDSQGTGIDISKEGILLASKAYFDIVWCVADLTKLPFMDKQFNVILNILSPANYDEFARTLADNGLLIKIVPGKDYLKQLREAFYAGTEKQTYSNDKVIEHYSKNFKILDMRQVMYTRTINKQNLIHLINMTPLSWIAEKENIEYDFEKEVNTITVDLNIIVGKKTIC